MRKKSKELAKLKASLQHSELLHEKYKDRLAKNEQQIARTKKNIAESSRIFEKHKKSSNILENCLTGITDHVWSGGILKLLSSDNLKCLKSVSKIMCMQMDDSCTLHKVVRYIRNLSESEGKHKMVYKAVTSSTLRLDE